jgi:hypothetical protein
MGCFNFAESKVTRIVSVCVLQVGSMPVSEGVTNVAGPTTLPLQTKVVPEHTSF